ncbi:BnaC07g51110D [Brassica napus]|uniref:(rape) hypothetical protein n=1 Tax=Brassica napus TaxID=3708 RepID=A0A078J5S4_BRANA|nr:unnamed protein product [Brassica napus]CDY59692.1 BnaC07g51110D [Brassica napus]
MKVKFIIIVLNLRYSNCYNHCSKFKILKLLYQHYITNFKGKVYNHCSKFKML